MNKNKKWYSLFLVMLISLATVIQPIQAVAAVTALDTVAEETQAKSMETPNVDNIDETNKVVEEEPATSVSEETKTTDTIEETISSEVTEETTASEEKTVESSTEETKESKEKPKAKALRAEREPRDIQKLLKEGEKFIETASVKVNGVDYPLDGSGEAIPHDANIDVYYHYNIPNRLLSEGDAPLMSGDFYEIDLPKGLQLKNGNGDLTSPEPENIVFGQYQYQNGKLKFTFNKKVEELSNIHGKTVYSHKLDTSNEVGEGFISIPYNDEETIEVPIFIKPTKGDEITKSGKASSDQKHITWEVSINTKLDELNNATVKDDLPNHIKFESVSIYPQRVNLQGKVVSVSEIPLVEGTDYILDKNTNNVTLIGRYAKTKESFKLVYETSVEDSIIPEDGGTIPVVNKATLINGDDEKVAPGKVNLKYGKLLDKSNPNRVKDSSAEGYVYSWQVYLNYGYKNLTPEQSKVTDKLTSNLKYIEGSVEVKSKAELSLVNGKDYIVKFNSDKNEMTIEFPKGLSTAVDISYKTEVVGTVDDVFKETSIKNQVSVGGKDPIVKSGTIAKNGIVKSGTVDYEKRKIKWTINFNTNHYELFNWSMIDTIPAGLTFIEGTLVIKSDSAKTPLPSSDYTHNLTKENELNVAFIGDLAKKGSKDSYTLTYETSFDRKVGTFVNKADTKWTDPTGDTEYKQKTTGNVTVNPFYVTDVSKYGEYDPNEKQLQWNVIVNYSQDELKNATISDPITGNQKLLKESVKVYELKINSDGSTSRVKEVTKDVSIEISDDNVFIKLPDGSKSAYELELKTSLANKDIAAKYQNTAIFENNGHKEEGPFTVNIPDGGILIRKNGDVDWDGNSNYLKWSVDINPTQSTINNLVIIDKPSNNQIIDKKSIKLFGTTLGAEKKYNKDRTKVLEEGKDYKVNLDTNNETGQQILTVEFLSTVTKMYVLEYKSLMTPMKLNVNETFLNNISMTGNGQIPIETGDSKDVTVWTSSGTANGDTASFTLVKESKTSKEKLAGAEFELWTSVDKSGKLVKGQLVRSGITDDNGELKIGRLIPNTTYLLFETKSPKGYSVSEELQKGYPLKLESDGMTNLFKPQTFINDIPRIQLKKVDAKTKGALADATFVIKNADGKFYNGIDEKNKPQWVVSEKEAKEIVSGKDGIIEVTGLEPGVYSTKEIKAPEGYDKLTQDVAFEVVDYLGWIRLKNPVTIENKAYETTFITINKTWDDASNQDGIRSDEITFDLLADGTVVDKLTLSKKDIIADKNIWTKTFDGLRKFDENMKEITYSVKEHEVSGYVIPKEELEVKNREVNVTNTYKPKLTSISGTKTWVDENDQDGIRPDKVIINLLADGKEIKEVVVNEASDWKYEFKDLPVYKVGEVKQLVKYTVTENKVEGYETTEKNNNFTNTHIPATTRVLVEKDWADYNNQDGKRPKEILVQLLANNKEIAGKTLKLEAAKGWKAEFSNLPLKINGKDIAYTIKEIVAEKDKKSGYKPSYDIKKVITKESNTQTDRNEVSHFEAKVTNTKTMEPTTVSGVKTWSDDNNRDGVRPESIEIQLLADGQPALDLAGKPVKSLTVKGGNTTKTWSYEFTNIPKHRTVETGKVAEKAEEIVYTVKEVMSEALKTNNYASKATGMNVTNSREIELTKISGIKTWSDDNNRDGVRPESIEVQLLADGKPALDKDGKEIPVKEVKGGNTVQEWTYEFKDLPKHKAVKAGEELVEEANRTIVYTVKEVMSEELELNNYTSEATDMNITNSREIELTEVSGKKIWNDNENRSGARPELIEVQLLADGEPALDKKGKEIPVKEVKGGNTEVEWTYEFTNLPKHKAVKVGEELVEEADRAIVYTVKEVISEDLAKNGYIAVENGMDLTNTREVIEIPVTKIWKDANNKDGVRPESIKVQLLADGKEAKDVKGEKIISEVTGSMKSNEWIDTFKDLPKFANGKEIKYSIKEIEISKEYEVTYSDDTFTITNTHTPKEVPTSGGKSTNNKSNNNKSGYLPKTGEAETTALVNLGVTMIVIFLMSHIWLSQRRKSKED